MEPGMAQNLVVDLHQGPLELSEPVALLEKKRSSCPVAISKAAIRDVVPWRT